MKRRNLLAGLFGTVAAVALPVLSGKAEAAHAWWHPKPRNVTRKKIAAVRRIRKRKVAAGGKRRSAYQGRKTVAFFSGERPGTIIVKTRERALYFVLGGGQAIRYGVAVGKEGFGWSGVARVGSKAVNPRWTPPAEMIERTPKYAKWADGMPGGIPENPLGSRALYLYQGRRDTMYRIHGTNAPWSIGTAASSGCIRMLNDEVAELYSKVRIGAKVIVQ